MADTDLSEADSGLELVLEHLKQTRAFDFTGYRRPTLARRIEKRMEQVGVRDHEEYVDYLEVHPDEFEPLFNTILINVTSFFRDPDAWDVVRERVIPELLARKPYGTIRVWSAGCSSGQEAYSAVMLLADAMGPEMVKERVKVYATDIDEEALEQARQATYSGRELESLPDGYTDKYFEAAPNGLSFSTDLRRSVIFGRHDLLQDAPISRVDLLICRNTLMYFNSEAQNLLVHRLHFSLADGGHLLLGKVEMLLGQSELFEAIDVKQRLFRKLSAPTIRSRLLAIGGAVPPHAPTEPLDRLIDASFDAGADAQLILDGNDLLVAVNEAARTLLGIPPEVVGRPFQDLEISYRPVELRSAIDDSRSSGRPVHLPEVGRWNPGGELTYVDIVVSPLQLEGRRLGSLLSFIDVTRHRQLQEELEQTHRELEVAYEELQSANEELETTNEELQSTIEELETTNEELQSTNEELETMNEELSSTNEELHAINDELRDRTTEVDRVNAYMESILTSLDASVIVVDTDLLVRVWNGHSYDMWGLRSDEVEGQPLLALDVGFPAAALRASLVGTLADAPPAEPLIIDAHSRRGQSMRCRVRVSALRGGAGSIEGAVLVIEPIDPS